jgi:hypothetical protein
VFADLFNQIELPRYRIQEFPDQLPISIVMYCQVFLINIHKLNDEIDSTRGRISIPFAHYVLLAQQGDIVLYEKIRPFVAIGQDGAAYDHSFMWSQFDFQGHRSV